MALASVSAFASYDQSARINEEDISDYLSEALIMDFHLLGTLNVDMGNPVTDIVHYWEEDSLNSDKLTLTISLASGALSITHSASSAPHVGDFVTADIGGTNSETMQITAVNSTTNCTVSRSINSTTAASIANSGTVTLQRKEQEFSDIGSDASVNPTVRLNYTEIIPARDLQISGSQLARKMATAQLQDQVAHQLGNRMIEWKRGFTKSLLYSERLGPGSDSVYRALGGYRYWAKAAAPAAQLNTTASTLTLAILDAVNKSIVDQGKYPDTLVVGTDLVGSVNAVDYANRRMLESDTKAGYVVNTILLGQGNAVDVVVDGRVNSGDALLFNRSQFVPRPLQGRAMFTIAGQDWVDGRKRRVLGEWTCEVRNPETLGYLTNKI